jgi:hypothetical protein
MAATRLAVWALTLLMWLCHPSCSLQVLSSLRPIPGPERIKILVPIAHSVLASAGSMPAAKAMRYLSVYLSNRWSASLYQPPCSATEAKCKEVVCFRGVGLSPVDQKQLIARRTWLHDAIVSCGAEAFFKTERVQAGAAGGSRDDGACIARLDLHALVRAYLHKQKQGLGELELQQPPSQDAHQPIPQVQPMQPLLPPSAGTRGSGQRSLSASPMHQHQGYKEHEQGHDAGAHGTWQQAGMGQESAHQQQQQQQQPAPSMVTSMTTVCLVQLVWAFAAHDHSHPALLQAMAPVLALRIMRGQLSASQVACVAWGYAKLQHDAPTLFQAIHHHAMKHPDR